MTKLVSVNVGRPRAVTWQSTTVNTAIFKTPVDGPVTLRRHNLDGDGQADLSVHGGPTKAAYVYSREHYDYWRDALGDPDLSWGAFGENFTVEGVDEATTCIGDEFRIGSARVVVTEPRMPCSKLGVRFGRADMVKRFLASQRMGFYFGVVQEGQVEVGDRLERVVEHAGGLCLAEVTRLYSTDRTNEALLRKAVSVAALPESWRGYFEHQLERLRS